MYHLIVIKKVRSIANRVAAFTLAAERPAGLLAWLTSNGARTKIQRPRREGESRSAKIAADGYRVDPFRTGAGTAGCVVKPVCGKFVAWTTFAKRNFVVSDSI